MNLQETAFMINLIKANYRRRMSYFFANILAVTFILTTLITLANFGIRHSGVALFSLVVVFSIIFRMLFVYIVGVGKDNSINFLFTGSLFYFPWNIKRRQMKALNEAISVKANFEDLGNSAFLREYFDTTKF
jgi:hypothetical protein